MHPQNHYHQNNNHNFMIILVVLFTLLFVMTQGAIIINDVEATIPAHEALISSVIQSIPLFYGQGENYQNINVSGTLIYRTSAESLDDLSGYIILYDEDPTQIYESAYRVFQKKGAVAVICSYYYQRVPGQLMYFLDGSGVSDITIPVVQILRDDYYHPVTGLKQRVYVEKDIINVTITLSETNMWKVMNEDGYMHFFSAFIGVPSFLLLVESFRRLYYVVNNSAQKIKLSAVSCLALCAFANLVRIIFAIDPMRSHKIFPSNIAAAAIVAPLVSGLIPIIVLAFCLHDVVRNKNIKVTTFLSTLRIPFFVTLVIFSVFGFVMTLLVAFRINGNNNSVTTATIIIIQVIDVGLAIYFGFVSRQILVAMKNSKKHSKHLLRAAVKLGLVCGGMSLQILVGITVVFPIIYTPYAYNTIYLFIFIFSILITGGITSFFDTKRSDKKSTSSTNSNGGVRSGQTYSKSANSKGRDGERDMQMEEVAAE